MSERYRRIQEELPRGFTPDDKVLVSVKQNARAWHRKDNPCKLIKNGDIETRTVQLIQVPNYTPCGLCVHE